MFVYATAAAAIIAAIAIEPLGGSAAAKGPIPKTAWQPLCDRSSRLKQSQQAAKHVIENHGTSTAKAQQMAQRLGIYIETLSSQEQKKKFLPLFYAMLDKTQALRQADKQAADEAMQFLTHAMYTAGRIDEFGQLLLSTGTSAELTCIGDTGDSGLARSSAEAQFVGCTNAPGFETPSVTAKAAAAIANSGDTAAEVTARHHSTSKDCPLTGNSATDTPFHASGIWNGVTVNLAGGLATLDGTNTKVLAVTPHQQDATPTTTNSAAQWYHNKLKGSSTKITGNVGNITADDLISAPNLREYVKATFKIDEASVTQKITDLYGAAGGDFRKNFWQNIELAAVDEAASTNKKSEELIKIKDAKDLHVAAIYYRTKLWQTIDDQSQTIKKLQEKSENKNAKIEETTCNAAGDDQKKCDKLKDKGCVFNSKREDGKTVS
uniref:Variant surface glycoprotein 1125.1269 n=1 Tax=Trypanosoma brucei TaxID=5691 RepID=A0A1J0R6K6_9TRYP|nr:variant surface glycoprotein 1125.1269 [Trypanosoma brucei]